MRNLIIRKTGENVRKISVSKMFVIASLLIACICVFAACSEEEPVVAPTASPTAQVTTGTTTPPPVIEYDETKFVVEGSVLVEYIGQDTEVTVPDNITVIGVRAFSGRTDVTKVEFPRTVRTIEAYAFDGCSGLAGEFIMPYNLANLGNGAFKDCTGITSFNFESCSTKLKTWGTYVFEGCSGLQTIALPESLTTIPEGFFKDCTSLTTVTLTRTSKITSISDYAFENCSALAKFDMTAEGSYNKITAMGDYVFKGCTALNEILFSNALQSIGYANFDDTLWYASKIENAKKPDATDADKFITVGKDVLIEYPFSGDTSLVIPSNVYAIASGALDSCIATLETITFAAEEGSSDPKLAIIDPGVFKNASKLKSIVIPINVSVISDDLFSGCTSLTTISLKGKVLTIGKNAFRDCASLEEIYLPDSITLIDDYAFYGCTSLTEIVISDSMTRIGNYAFMNCTNISNFIFPLKLSEVGIKCFNGTKWYEALDDEYSIIGDGILIKANVPAGEDIVIPDTVKSIASFTFTGYTEISDDEFYNSSLPKSITLPSSVTSIGQYAFYFCINLETIDIPDSVTYIGQKAFYGCPLITEINLPEGLKEISDYLFYGCANLSKVSIPSTVEKIGKFAFYNCVKLDNIDVPAAVNEIGACAFVGTPWFNYNGDEFFTVGNNILIKCSASNDSVVVPSTITAIVGGAFDSDSIKSVKLPDSIKVIPEYAFSGCSSLTEIKFASDLKEIKARAFNACSSLVPFDVPGCEIHETAFANCKE